jgi:hypothetical protein
MSNNQINLQSATQKIDTSTFVDPLEAARKQRLSVAGDALATAGVEVHGDNAGGSIRPTGK